MYRLLADQSPQPTLELPSTRIRHFYVEPFVRRAANAVCSEKRAVVWQHRAMEWFDRWCGRRLPDNLDAVVCYENASLHTFRAAKKQGIATILDAASIHHKWQDELFDPLEHETAHNRIVAHKNREIALADHILTVSDLARRSYLAAGAPREQVTAVPVGTDLSAFAPKSAPPSSDGPYSFIFVGHARRLKGVDTLLSASDRLCRSVGRHRIRFAGGVSETFRPRLEQRPQIESLGYLDEENLAAAYRQADCLVLPSRFDSFGRVVVEALASGTPVIVSEHVGAKEVVTDGRNGWIVPAEDVNSLADRMQWCVTHRDAVADMQAAAVAAAQRYTWAAYRERVTGVLKNIVRDAVPT
jgi:glycosyltransferase involved in cell wall biosynthesis